MTRLAILAAMLPSIAFAHTHPSGFQFDATCCGGSDCAEIPASAVSRSPDGYRITLKPGDHPLVTTPRSYFIQRAEKRENHDGLWFACLYPTEAHLRCLYKPMEAY